MDTINKYICDTNIWVNICLSEKNVQFFKVFNSLFFADCVKNEINKWGRSDNKYSKIHSIFEENENNSFKVIYLKELDSITKKIIEQQLVEFGFSNWDNSDSIIKDLGEYISVLYAYHLEIPMLQTDDVNFYESIDLANRFKDIEIMTWNDIASKLTNNDTERINLNKLIEIEKKYMRIKQAEEIAEKALLKKKMEDLKNKFSKR